MKETLPSTDNFYCKTIQTYFIYLTYKSYQLHFYVTSS